MHITLLSLLTGMVLLTLVVLGHVQGRFFPPWRGLAAALPFIAASLAEMVLVGWLFLRVDAMAGIVGGGLCSLTVLGTVLMRRLHRRQGQVQAGRTK